MKRPKKRDDVGALRVISRQLDGGFDGFRSGVREKCFCGAFKRRDLRDRFAESDLGLVKEVGGNVKEARRLSGDSTNDIGMCVTGRGNRNAGTAGRPQSHGDP